MLVNGSMCTDKTIYLVKYFVDLIKKGVDVNQILVVILNSYKKADFIKKINNFLPENQFSTKNILTFSGLCYNAFLENWEYISKFTHSDYTNNRPNLCGLEVSQYIFKESIKTADFSDYISKVNLLHQLFRRYSLIVQNCLSDNEVRLRSKILCESFAKDAQKAIDDYKLKTFKYNSFDYLRQIAVFPLIYKNTDYFRNIKYFIADDCDEFSFAFWQFLNAIKPNLSDYMLGYDEKGSTRCGYLCAYKSGISDFIKKYSPQIINLENKSQILNIAENFYNAIKLNKKVQTEDIKYISTVKRLDMLNEVSKEIKKLLSKGIKEEEIAVITPIQDEVLTECFETNRINFQLLSGSEKLSDDKYIKFIVIILKLINNLKVSDYELKNILINLLKIPFNKSYEILKEYQKEKVLKDFKNTEYTKFISLIKAQSTLKTGISEQIKIIYENLLKNKFTDFSQNKYEFLIKEAQSFETAFQTNVKNLTEEFIIQTENSIISENPAETIEIKRKKVIISSPQKIIDFAYKTKYQFYLDISSPEWIKNDTGTLYNAWVFSKDWSKQNFTLEDNIELTNNKTARIVRKLMLCCEKEIIMFSSLYDNLGNENFGGISNFISINKLQKTEFKIIPRPDQAPVLEYKSGKLGIMAVPGAGKTTILLALIIKLLKRGIKSENIFVLTYMESAAKNFKEKIKSAMPESFEIPNISTIHGLALRIIKENGNYSKIGLDDNFEICDDNLKENIIRGLFFNLKLDEEKYDNYVKCISDIKLSCFKGDLYSKYKEIQDFYNFYNEYNQYLKQNNMIDYDDMLYLAVKILEENSDIKQYYQNICKYIIEDEAQDSTDIQQRLIGILNEKYNNLVRCGDINQAITSTFTNSNPLGFRKFIQNNQKIEMVSSQRCAKPIYTLANNFLKESLKITEAFYPIEMQGTEKNPKTIKKPEYIEFNNEKEEKEFIINKIKEIRTENPSSSVAILLRLNSQVNEYNELLISNNIKTAVRLDCPAQKNIYKIIYSLLKIINMPLNNANIYDFAVLANQKGVYKFKQLELDYIKGLKIPFINLNAEDIESEALLQLYFDISYHLNNSTVPIDILALNIGGYYAENDADKSNVYMIATLIKRISSSYSSEEELINKLDYAAQKNSGTYKFFDNNYDKENVVNIMTMHKAKGDEFDYVFIPELNEENYSTSTKNVKIKTGSHFVQTIKSQISNEEIKTIEELKEEQVKETLRLLYVGITRAKEMIYFTNAKEYKRRKNTREVDIIKRIINNTLDYNKCYW